MKTYTIKFKEHDQDNLNIIPFEKGDKMPSFLIYEEVLLRSISEGWIESENDIKTLLDGSDHIEPRFSTHRADDECKFIIEDDYNRKFDSEETEYNLFEEEEEEKENKDNNYN